MRSPFPGMDPYLEVHWLDVHPALCTYARDSLNKHLPGDLTARLGQRVVLENQRDEPLRQSYVQIIETATATVVASVEFPSPFQKATDEARRKYLESQANVIRAGIGLAAIDLVRTGDCVLLTEPDRIPSEARAAYCALVFRGYGPKHVEYYPMPLPQRLPSIRMPLRASDPDVALDIQALVDQAYVNGRYGALIDYGKPCTPPLVGEELRWAKELLRGRGRG